MLDHAIMVRRSPINYTVRCSCGWSRTIAKQNALARAAKVRAAITEHERTIERTKDGGTEP